MRRPDAATAANDIWKPGSTTLSGSSASTTNAASARLRIEIGGRSSEDRGEHDDRHHIGTDGGDAPARKPEIDRRHEDRAERRSICGSASTAPAAAKSRRSRGARRTPRRRSASCAGRRSTGYGQGPTGGGSRSPPPTARSARRPEARPRPRPEVPGSSARMRATAAWRMRSVRRASDRAGGGSTTCQPPSEKPPPPIPSKNAARRGS